MKYNTRRSIRRLLDRARVVSRDPDKRVGQHMQHVMVHLLACLEIPPGKRSKIPPELKAAVLRMAHKGYVAHIIAEAHGISRRSVCTIIAEHRDLKSKRAGTSLPGKENNAPAGS